MLTHSERLVFAPQPLLDLERNGRNLHYNVWWRRKDAGEEWSNVTTVESKYTVAHTDTYVPYEIKIQARNEFGSGPESNVVVGFSGEDCEWIHTRSCVSERCERVLTSHILSVSFHLFRSHRSSH